MIDSPERALKEAESWLVSAKHSLVEAQSDEASATVSCSQAIHGVIRANDALCLKFLGHKTTRHDDAAVAYAKLLREGKLPTGADRFKDLVADAMRDKSGADYGKGSFSDKDAEKYCSETEKFVAMAKGVVK